MNRRTLILAASVAALVPAAARAEFLHYKPGLVEKALAEGKTVFVDFFAAWCPTCQRQHRIIDAMKAGNPDYDRHITFVEVEWDRYRGEALAKRLRIPRRSTLVVLKGERELGRLVASTSNDEIRRLLDTALAAATSA